MMIGNYFFRYLYKRASLVALCLQLLVAHLNAQEVTGFVNDGSSFINHTVKQKENIDTLASLYGIKSTVLLSYNKLQKNAYLSEQSVVKIPLAGSLSKTCEGSNCVKVYYEVQPQEGLYRIGKNFGDLKADDIKQMNGLPSNALSIGQRILVGYIKINRINTVNTSIIPAATTSGNVSTEPSTATNDSIKDLAIENSPKQYLEIKSFFESEFRNGQNKKQLHAGTFKSESGWNDGKFYALMDDVPVGAIIKIEDPRKGSVIYARIVGPLPDINTKQQVNLRISNAAASSLKEDDENEFDVTVQY